LESGRVAADAAFMTMRGEWSKTKDVAAARDTVRSRRRGANEGLGAATEGGKESGGGPRRVVGGLDLD
jgi:hypothetical protein